MGLDRDFKIGLTLLQTFHHASQQCIDINSPPIKDHRMADNPYLSLYGTDNWEDELEKDSMKEVVCVTSMITHVYKHTKALYTQGGDSRPWYFYHDSLSLMTGKETVEWMKEKGYYKHWILPEKNVVHHIPKCFTWRNMLPGNTPGGNPLDMQCFADVNSRLDDWVRLTEGYEKNDPRKYSLQTPLCGFDSVNRVWKSTPCSKRIVEDILEIPNTYKIIVEGGGILCDRDQNTGGGRHHRRGNHGGRREKGVFSKRNRNDREFPVDGMDAIKGIQTKACEGYVAKKELDTTNKKHKNK